MPPKKKQKASLRETLLALAFRREIRVFVGGLLLVGTASAFHSMENYVRLFLRRAVTPASGLVALSNPPTWLKSDDPQRVLREINQAAPESRNPSAGEIAKAFSSPWVRSAQVKRVQGVYRVDLDVRLPVQAIAWGKSCCYADRDGVPLDIRQVEPEVAAACVTVEGLSTSGTPRIGEALKDPVIPQIGRLVERLTQLRPAIDVEIFHQSAEGRIELRTRQGGRIWWGMMGPNDAAKLASLGERIRSGESLPPGCTWDVSQTRVSSPLPGSG